MSEATEFVHLHTHSLFSVLDGIASPRGYMEKCVERGWKALALTEHGNMASIPDAVASGKELQIKPIVGMEAYFNDYHPHLRRIVDGGTSIKSLRESGIFAREELARRMTRNRHLTILCKNHDGYRNLLSLSNHAWEHGMYYRPRIWFDLLGDRREGLIVLSGCLNGPVSFELREHVKWMREYEATGEDQYLKRAKNNLRMAADWHLRFRRTFGDDYYVELQMPGVPDDEDVFKLLVKLAKSTKTKMVMTNDSHYLDKKDYELQKLMMAIDQGLAVDDPELFHTNADEQFFKDRNELRQTFLSKDYRNHCSLADFENSCDNTLEIADKCEGFKLDSDPKLPEIENASDELRKICVETLKKKGLCDKRYMERLDMELDRIVQKGFASYFLITRDLIGFSRSHGFATGPSRGSVGGCLVAYAAGITELNPLLRWGIGSEGLSFDRFLSPSRGGVMMKVTMK